MQSYRINIDKKVLRLLGAQLYGDTPSIISELVQNAYDADAKSVWITINTTNPSTIIVQDNGIGMTPEEINISAEKKFQNIPYEITVLDKSGNEVKRNFSFCGWIGTIHERPSFKNFITHNYETTGQTKFEVSLTDNRITIFSRGKIGEFDILPKVQTNRIANAYVIGELYVNMLEDDDLTDMAISNRIIFIYNVYADFLTDYIFRVLCLMSAGLRVVVFHGCTFFRIYRLEDGVLSVLRFDG